MIPKNKKPNTISVAEYLGKSSLGDVHADPVEVPALIEGRHELVLNELGEEELSTSTVYVDPLNVSTSAKVRLWVGTDLEHEAKVISVTHFRNLRLAHTVLRVR